MKLIILAIGSFMVILILAGLLIPIEKYTSTDGCDDEPIPTIRLNLIMGDTMASVKNRRPPSPTEGCSLNANYELYVL